MAKKKHYGGRGAPVDGRSPMDNSMITEDHSAVANLPQGVVMRTYAKAGNYYTDGLDDTIRGVDRQISDDMTKKKKDTFPTKY